MSYGDGFVDRIQSLAPSGVDAATDGVGGMTLDVTDRENSRIYGVRKIWQSQHSA